MLDLLVLLDKRDCVRILADNLGKLVEVYRVQAIPLLDLRIVVAREVSTSQCVNICTWSQDANSSHCIGLVLPILTKANELILVHLLQLLVVKV